jgi:hypothetical protein
MKTLTEFATVTLKAATKTKNELIASGKTAEELPAALGEALKLEGDKLTYLMGALEVMGEKTNDLKRVVVQALNEGEKAPHQGKLIGDKYYTAEFYVSMRAQAPQEPSRDDKRGGKRGGKPGDKRGGPGGGRPGEGRNAGGPGGDSRGPRSPGGPGRGPRPAAVGGAPSGGLPKPLAQPKAPEPKTEG